jgi:hypothetical protein
MTPFHLLHEHQAWRAAAGLLATINGIMSRGVGGGGSDDGDGKPTGWEANQEGMENGRVWLLGGTHMKNPTWNTLLVLLIMPFHVGPIRGWRLFY